MHLNIFILALKDKVTDLICLVQDNLSSMVTPKETDDEL